MERTERGLDKRKDFRMRKYYNVLLVGYMTLTMIFAFLVGYTFYFWLVGNLIGDIFISILDFGKYTEAVNLITSIALFTFITLMLISIRGIIVVNKKRRKII